jgi:hypothetical protein
MPNGFPMDRLARLRGEVLRPEVAGWPRDDLARAFAQRGIASPEDAEDFLGWINQNVVPRLGSVAAGAAKGAVAGSVVPGWGTLLGALGGAASGFLSPGNGAAAAAPPHPSVSTQPPLSSGVPGGGGQGSMSGLLATALQSPDIQKAVLQLVLGKGLAKPTVQLRSGEEVPVEAFAEALGTIAEAALAEYASTEPEAEATWERERERPSWLEGPRRRGGDVSDPLLRALVLTDLLKQPTNQPVPVAAVPVAPFMTPPGAPYPATPASLTPVGPSPAPSGVGGYEPSWAPSYGLPDLTPRPLQEQYAEALRRSVAENEFLISLESLDEGW